MKKIMNNYLQIEKGSLSSLSSVPLSLRDDIELSKTTHYVMETWCAKMVSITRRNTALLCIIRDNYL